MKTLVDYLSQYAAYHRNSRNLATHFVGIPMIVLAVTILMSRCVWLMDDRPLSLAMVAVIASVIFYVRLDAYFGLTMAGLLGLSLWASQWFVAQAFEVWLGWGVGLFVVGWAFQFVGHYYEGKKPAFVDDLVGLLVGPLFLVAEIAFALQLRQALREEMRHRMDDTHFNRMGGAAV